MSAHSGSPTHTHHNNGSAVASGPLRWGIAAAGLISHDFVNAISTLPVSDHRVVAVAARDGAKAKAFAELHGIERSHEGYAALAADYDVDVVYVGAMNPQHLETVLLMLRAGKPVLCEKPLCMNAAQVEQVLAAAKERKLFVMEAIWSRLFPAYQWVRRQLQSGALGDVRQVEVQFGFPIEHVERLAKKELGGGTVLDLGVYTIQLAQWCFGAAPETIAATGQLNEDGCDMAMQAELTYPGGGVARIATSALEQLSNEAVIRCTKGTIRVPDFWCPTKLIAADGSEKQWQLPEGARTEFKYKNSSGLSFEAEEVRRCLRTGLRQSDSVTHANSLVIAQIEDEIRRQIGVVYEADKTE